MQYYFSHDGQNQQGPIEPEQMIAAGVTANTLVWRDGLSGWIAAKEVPELLEVFQQNAAATPVATAVVTQPIQYQQPQHYYTGAPRTTNGLAIASMICGIVGIMSMCVYGLGAVPSILAIIFGHIARGQIRRDKSDGDGMAMAGLIMGYIAVGIVAATVIVFALIFIFAIGASAASGGRGGF